MGPNSIRFVDPQSAPAAVQTTQPFYFEGRPRPSGGRSFAENMRSQAGMSKSPRD